MVASRPLTHPLSTTMRGGRAGGDKSPFFHHLPHRSTPRRGWHVCVTLPAVEDPKIKVQKTGSIWHGLVEGHPEIDERGLTAEIAERKAKDALSRLRERLERQA